MNIIKNLTFEKLVLMAIMVLLTSVVTTEKNHFSVKLLACSIQVIILIWLILKK